MLTFPFNFDTQGAGLNIPEILDSNGSQPTNQKARTQIPKKNITRKQKVINTCRDTYKTYLGNPLNNF